MTAKEYLSGAKNLNRQITADLYELSMLREMIGAINAIDYARDRVQVSPENSLEKSIVKLISLEEKINQQIDTFVDTKNEMKSKISVLKNMDEKLVLQYTYLCFKERGKVAEIMNYSLRQIKRIHKKALLSFERCHPMSP